jgi:hypothetical protein
LLCGGLFVCLWGGRVPGAGWFHSTARPLFVCKHRTNLFVGGGGARAPPHGYLLVGVAAVGGDVLIDVLGK